MIEPLEKCYYRTLRCKCSPDLPRLTLTDPLEIMDVSIAITSGILKYILLNSLSEMCSCFLVNGYVIGSVFTFYMGKHKELWGLVMDPENIFAFKVLVWQTFCGALTSFKFLNNRCNQYHCRSIKGCNDE